MELGGISFLGRSLSNMSRIKTMTGQLTDLQRQLTTQKKYDSYAGFGFEALNVQRYRMDKGHLDTYIANIDKTKTRIELMSNSMTRAAQVGRQLLESISIQVREGTIEMDSIKTLAKDSLEFMRDILNIEVDGRYLFSGSATDTVPFSNETVLSGNMQTQVSNWLNGTQTTTQLVNGVNGMPATALGFDPALSTAGRVSIRIDRTTEIDYTIMANDSGFEDIVRALSLAATLDLPSSTDTPTLEQFHDVLNGVTAIAQRGVAALDRSNAGLASKINLIKNIEESHKSDLGLFDKLLATQENADTTEVAVKIQALQTQLTASYELTRIVSQLSLVNFI